MTPPRCGTRSSMRSQGLTSHWTRRGVDRALGALGDFADLVSPSLVGHSSGVAQLAGDAATEAGLAPAQVTRVRRAGLIHDIGRVAIDPRNVAEEGSSLNADEWEQVRLHAYHTERVFNRSPLLAPVAAVACRHHERMDGSGYHRGSERHIPGAGVWPARRCRRLPRHDRTPGPSALDARWLKPPHFFVEESAAGRHDGEMVAAVLCVRPVNRLSPVDRPAGLTEREKYR